VKLVNVATKIVNVVATATLDNEVDLEYLKQHFPDIVIFDPSAYHAPAPAYFKSKTMKGKISIFPSGRMISVGTSSEEEAREELVLMAKILETANMAKLKTEPKIENIVVTADLGFKLDLKKICKLAKVRVTYEPKRFPGAVIRFVIKNSKITVLLFSSGKLVCMGLKNEKIINVAISQLLELLHKQPINQ